MGPWGKFSYDFKFLDSHLKIHFTIANSKDPQTWDAVKDLSLREYASDVVFTLGFPGGNKTQKAQRRITKIKKVCEERWRNWGGIRVPSTARKGKPSDQILFMCPLALHLLLPHWPKQVTWASLESLLGETNQGHGKRKRELLQTI